MPTLLMPNDGQHVEWIHKDNDLLNGRFDFRLSAGPLSHRRNDPYVPFYVTLYGTLREMDQIR